MGSSRPRNSTRAKKAPSAKRTSPSARRTASRTPTPTKPRVPAVIQLAIDEQRDSVGTAISLLYCLHLALRREIEDGGRIESEALEDAVEWADLTDISAMLLVRLHGVHSGLDSVALREANPDPEMVTLMEKVRELVGDSQP